VPEADNAPSTTPIWLAPDLRCVLARKFGHFCMLSNAASRTGAGFAIGTNAATAGCAAWAALVAASAVAALPGSRSNLLPPVPAGRAWTVTERIFSAGGRLVPHGTRLGW